MKYIFHYLAIILIISISATSCTKDDITETETEDPIENPVKTRHNDLMDDIQTREDGTLDLGCFSVNLPFSLTVNDDIYVIETATDLEDVLLIFETNPDSTFIDFVYPISVVDQDQNTVSIQNGEELGLLFATCIPDGGYGSDQFPAFLIDMQSSCYSMIYPVTLSDLTGNEFVAVSDSSIIELLSEQELLFFNFPINLLSEDQEVITVNEVTELINLLVECTVEGGFVADSFYLPSDINLCYDLQFPATILTFDEEEIVVNNHDEYCNLLLNGKVNTFKFPISLVDYESQETVVVTSESQLRSIVYDCIYNGGFNENNEKENVAFWTLINADAIGCFNINYPIEIISIDSTVITLNNNNDAIAQQEVFLNLIYPVSITYDGGTTLTLNNSSEALQVAFECFEDGGFTEDQIAYLFLVSAASNNSGGCYEIVFPIQVITDGGELKVDNLSDAIEIIDQGPMLIYPLDVIVGGDVVIRINEFQDIVLLLNTCPE